MVLKCLMLIFPDFFVVKTGESTLNVIAIQATLHLPYDHRYLVQNLSTQVVAAFLLLHYFIIFTRLQYSLWYFFHGFLCMKI